MSDNETAARERDGWTLLQWTTRRTRLAGGGAIIGGLAALTISSLIDIPIGRLGSNPDFGLLWFVYASIYLLFAVSLVAAGSRFTSSTDAGGRKISLLLAAVSGLYAGSILLVMAGRTLFEELFILAGIVTGFAYLAIRFLGTLYGFRLWQQGSLSRVTAGLFLCLFPALFVLGPLTTVRVPTSSIEAVVYLVFLALGVELIRSAASLPAGEAGLDR